MRLASFFFCSFGLHGIAMPRLMLLTSIIDSVETCIVFLLFVYPFLVVP